jgi:hypothetical protein
VVPHIERENKGLAMHTQADPIGTEAISIAFLALYLYSRLAVVWVMGMITLMRHKGVPDEGPVPAKRDNSV